MSHAAAQKHPDIIVIGASLGGLRALRSLLGELDAALPAAIFVVWHISPSSPAILADVLNAHGSLSAAYARDGESIRHGRIYIAPPDRHLLLTPDGIRLDIGPRENRFRPAIDPLFRSAAKSFGTRVIGVVLTGMLDDGTQGLWFIKRNGGATVVQDPSDAEAPEMPASEIEAGVVDYIVTLASMPALLARLTRALLLQGVEERGAVPMQSNSDDKKLEDLHPPGEQGPQVPVACPDCAGALWLTSAEPPVRYQCHVGHQFSEEGLASAKEDELELALWTALRVLKEHAGLYGTMAERAHSSGQIASAERLEQRMKELHDKAQFIWKTIATLPKNISPQTDTG